MIYNKMAEGGYDIEIQPIRDEDKEEYDDLDQDLFDEEDELIGRQKSKKRSFFRKTSTPSHGESSRSIFKDDKYDGSIILESKKYGKHYWGGEASNISEKKFLKLYPKANKDEMKNLSFGMSEFNIETVKIRSKRLNNIPYSIDYEISGKNKFPDKIKNILGLRVEEIMIENSELIGEKNDKIVELEKRQKLTTTSKEENDRIQEEIDGIEKEVEDIEEKNEELFERLSPHNKVKYIFKKYGFTVFSILTAVGTVIGVIVSNLSSSLASVAKGLGNGLKALAKRVAKILPGMVGAIVSFLFKTAGEALGFLAKNSWLLILFLVTFVVEKYSKNKK